MCGLFFTDRKVEYIVSLKGTRNFLGLNFAEANLKGFFCGLSLVDCKVEYIVSLKATASFQGSKFHAQQAYGEIHKFYVPHKFLHTVYVQNGF